MADPTISNETREQLRAAGWDEEKIRDAERRKIRRELLAAQRPMIIKQQLTRELLEEIEERGESVLSCFDCRNFYIPGPLRRYGDHACPSCDSTDVGRVTDETL